MNVGDAVEEVAVAAARPMLPWAILAAVVMVLSLMAGSFYQGWSMRGDREAASQLKAERAWSKKLADEKDRGDGLAKELDLEKQNIKTVTVEVIKEVPKVTTVYVEREGDAPKPIPSGVYTYGFVRLWDNALASYLPYASWQSAGAAGKPDTLRAPIDSPDILNNAVVNFGKYAACRAQLNALIDWHEGKRANSHGMSVQ